MIVRIFYNDINILQWHYRRDLIQQCGQNREPHSEPSYSVFLIYQKRRGPLDSNHQSESQNYYYYEFFFFGSFFFLPVM